MPSNVQISCHHLPTNWAPRLVWIARGTPCHLTTCVVGGPRRRDYSAPPAVFGLSHSGRHWTRFEVSTQPAGFLTKQATRSGMYTVHRQVKTHGHNTQQTRTLPTSRFPNGECSLQNKAKWYNDEIPITATHSHLPITLQLALI